MGWEYMVEFRKLISFGKTSFVMSIPKAWVQKNNLKKGNLISVEEKQGNLILSSQANAKGAIEKIELNVTNLSPMIKRIIASLYKGGYDEMDIIFSTSEELKQIQEVIKETCIGFEIVEQGKKMLKARKISDTIYEEFDPVMRRTFLFLKSMASESLDAIKTQDMDAIKNVILADNNVNKFTDFCRRVINKKSDLKFRKVPPLYYILEELEKIGDEYKDLCKYYLKCPIKLSKEILKFYEEVNEYFNNLYDLFYKFDTKKIKILGDKKQELDKEIEDLYKKRSKAECRILFFLNILIDRIFHTNGAIIAAVFHPSEETTSS